VTVDETSHGALVHSATQPPQSHGDSTHDATVASLASGKVPTSELGTGVADATTFLRGDQSWATPSGGSGMSITRISGASGAAGADLTVQILTANSADITTVALGAAAMTTTGVGAGTWRFRYTLLYQTAALTTGIAFGINHTGTVTKLRANWKHVTTGGAAATGVGDADTIVVAGQLVEGKEDFGLNAILGSASAGVDTINRDIIAIVEGIIVVSVTGSLELKIATEIAGSAVRITTSSMLELLKIA